MSDNKMYIKISTSLLEHWSTDNSQSERQSFKRVVLEKWLGVFRFFFQNIFKATSLAVLVFSF